MSSSFYPLGMNSYNNRLPQGGYKSSKGTGVFSNPTGVTAGNIRPLTNNDLSNSAPQKFGLPRPIKHYRKGISVALLENSTNSRQVKSSTGGGSLVGQMIDIPGGFSIKENPSNETSNTEELDKDCKTCQGVGIISNWQPITDLTEKPQSETQTQQYCCNQERNALRRMRSANTKLKKNYYTTKTNYLYNRCQTFDQKQFNYMSLGNAATKPGAPLSQDNIYKANCNPNLEIEYAASLLPDGITLTPSNPLGCETVQYKPNNYKYGQQGAVSSSDRMLRLNVDTIDANRANIIKNRENLTKSKYFPNASGTENNSCCIIGSKAVSSFGTTILYITYPLVTRTFRTLTQRFSFPSSFSSISDPPVPVIQNEYILVVPSYELIDPNTNKVKMTLKYQLFTNNDAELLTVGLSFANNVNYYNQNTSIIEIIQFDGMPLYGLGNQFSGLTPEILISAPDEPRIINGTSALNCFMDCTNFNSPGIINWNIANIVNLQGMFANASLFNQDISVWDTSSVTNVSYMFYFASAFNQEVTNWDVTNVTTMANMFALATNFNNGDITNIGSKSLNSWNTQSVTNMTYMFYAVSTFNQEVTNWDVTNVTTMANMFALATNFNNGDITNIGSKSLSSWDVSNCTSFAGMFKSASSFNQNVSNLVNTNTSGLTPPSGCNLSYMFQSATLFNNGDPSNNYSNLLNWDTTNVTNMTYMFKSASSFNQYIGNWNTARVTDMTYMFQTATLFNNGETGTLDISGNAPFTYTDGTRILTSTGSKFLTQLSPSSDVLIITAGTTTIYTSQIQSIVSDVSLVLLTAYGGALTPTSIKKQVAGSADLSWNTINVKNMSSLFSFAYYFNQKLPWNVSNVTNMSSMFAAGTTALRDLFNNGQLAGSSSQPLNWTATKCTNFTSMFAYTSGFNQPITTLVDTSGVTGCNLTSMFQNTTVFNQNVGAWNVSRVTAMNLMFANTSVFNNGRPLGASDASLNWYVPLCTTFASMFINAGAFNQPISTLVDTSGVAGCSLANMFQNSSTTVATTFNQNLSSWNVSRVTAMNLMFARTGAALPFNNGSLINDASNTFTWYAPNCTTFASMFINTTAFNQPISTLVDTSGVAGCSLTSMFQNAGRFNQNLNSWNVSRVTAMNSMFLRTGTTLPFNNGSLINDASNTLTWYAPNCTTFASMFVFSTAFNQPIPFLVDTSGVAGCSLSNMFQNAGRFNQNLNSWNVSRVTAMNLMFSGASIFNNGQTGTQDISGNLNTSFAFYTNATNLLTCISGNFLTLTSANVLIITTPTLVYSSRIQTNPISDVSLVLLTAYGADIPSGITSIKKQIAGTADLSWNTQLVTTTANMFQNATYFNQRLPWNMRVNRIVTSMFAGTATTFINLFNNGQILTGTTPTQPLYPGGGANIWDFSGGTITGGTTNAWRINSRLTSANGVTINPVLVYT